MTQLEKAVELFDFGFNVIALEEGNKRPHFGVYSGGNILPVFQSPHSIDDIEAHFVKYPNANIGILTSNCTVIDADCQEAIDYIEANFPPTPLVAKTSKGRHYFYGSSGIGRVSAKTPKGGEAFSIRGPGVCNYVVGAGSTHPDGSEYTWLKFGYLDLDELPTINQIMVEGLKNIFTKQPVVTGVPVSHGARNNTMASYVGSWISSGLSKEQTLARAMEVNNIFKPPLKAREVETTNNSIWKTHEKNNVEVPVKTEIETVKLYQPKEDAFSIPDEDLKPPGILGEFFDWHLKTARYPNARLAAQSALCFGSAVLGRRFVSSADNWPSLYFLTIGKSTTGKNHGIKTVERAIDAAGIGDDINGPRGFTSPSAILCALMRTPAMVSCIDEFGDYLEACSGNSNQYRREAMSLLNESFSTGDGVLRQAGYSGMGKHVDKNDKPLAIRCPAISLFLMTQPSTFYGSIGEREVRNGFLGRLLIVDMEAQRKKPTKAGRLTDPPERLSEWAKIARQTAPIYLDGELIPEIYSVTPKVTEVPITSEAETIFEALEAEQRKHQDKLEESGMDGVIGRMTEISMRLSVVIACSNNIINPSIGKAEAQWASNYCRFAFLRMVGVAAKNSGKGEFGKDRNRVLQQIIGSGGTGISRRDLKRKNGNMKPKDFEAIITELTETQEIAFIERKSGGRPSIIIVAIED